MNLLSWLFTDDEQEKRSNRLIGFSMVEFDFCTMTMYQVSDSLDLMHKLEPEIAVTSEMLAKAVESPKTHLFVATAPESAERQGVATG